VGDNNGVKGTQGVLKNAEYITLEREKTGRVRGGDGKTHASGEKDRIDALRLENIAHLSRRYDIGKKKYVRRSLSANS